MKYSIVLTTVAFFLSFCAAEAGPMPVGSDTMPLLGARHATPKWAKAHPKLTTAETPNVVHSCDKDLHSSRCVKKCVKKATEVQPSGPPPISHVRGGTAFAVRDKQAESTMLGASYSPKLQRKRQVQATILTAENAKDRAGSDRFVESKLTTAQTSGVVHTCDKNLHNYRCVKKCVVKTTEVGAPLP